jgi:ribonuclease P/MRP protein subunit RPP1
MKRTYADLHLRPNLNDFEHTKQMITKAAKLGYHLIAIPLPPNVSEENLQKMRGICREAKIDFATRLNLKPTTPDELTRNLRKFRRKYETIAVICESKNVARQAAKDRRVDILNFPLYDYHGRFFDLAEAELASGSLTAFEIDAQPILALEGPARSRLLSNLRRETETAKAFHIPIILSSGTSDLMLMRRPMDMAALASLFDLENEQALQAVSENPVGIVKRNRGKLNSTFVAPGIRVVRRGKDC